MKNLILPSGALQTFTPITSHAAPKGGKTDTIFPLVEKNRITLLISQTIFLTNEKNSMTNGIAFHQRETIFIR